MPTPPAMSSVAAELEETTGIVAYIEGNLSHEKIKTKKLKRDFRVSPYVYGLAEKLCVPRMFYRNDIGKKFIEFVKDNLQTLAKTLNCSLACNQNNKKLHISFIKIYYCNNKCTAAVRADILI